MISERENFFKMARGEEREFVPAVMNLFQMWRALMVLAVAG